MALPKFLQPYLASYDLKSLDRESDKQLVITQILNKGDDKAVKWLFKNYSLSEIKKVVKNPQRGMWFPSSLNYWIKIFNLKIPDFTYQLAILSLGFRPKLYQNFFKKNL